MLIKDQIIDGVINFACQLYKTLDHNNNLFFSPHSISTAMSLAYAGAQGETADQIAKVFGYPQTNQDTITESLMSLATSNEDKIKLVAANSLWVQAGYSLLEEYHRKMGSLISEVDFGNTVMATARINKWVENNTNNLIKDLIPPDLLNNLVKLILVNAIYFKGSWTKAFNPEETRLRDFHCLDGRVVKADMMFAKEMEIKTICDRNRMATRLYYGNNSVYMTIILPNNFSSYVTAFDGCEFKQVQQQLDNTQEDEIDLYLPKFKLESTLSLQEKLMELGVKNACIPGLADFSGITGNRGLFVSNVLHKAVIDVSEEGTEAAAATAMLMRFCCDSGSRFIADKPFIFVICEENGTPLFMGHVVSF